MQNNNGVKQRFLDCFLKILDKKRKKWRELLPDQYMDEFISNHLPHNQILQPLSSNEKAGEPLDCIL
jgi:hypothetical protein